MTTHTRRFALLGALAASSLLLAACGSDSADDSSARKDFNDADVSFAQMMIPHHEQALEMAALADGRAADAEIKTLVGEIEKAQDPEIKTLKVWLKDWDKPESAEMHHGDDGMAGMMSEDDMTGLKAAKGADFDRKFAELMIEHHNGAIEMAEEEQKGGRNAEAKELAGDVVESQSAEVEQLREILERL